VSTPAAGRRRLDVLDLGDSLGIDLGWGLAVRLRAKSISFQGLAVGDSGLDEPWFYNWPAHLAADLARYRPSVVVVFLGANDTQNLYVNGRFDLFGSPEWARVYGQRVARLMEEVTATGARLLWVGVPAMADTAFSTRVAQLNRVYRLEAAQHREVCFIPARALNGPAGKYEAAKRGTGGTEVVLRDPDGVHLTWAGADVLAGAVVARLEALHWLASGASRPAPTGGATRGG
jgi:hypothetical protein